MACALRQPHRGWLMAISRSQARSRCSTPSGRCGPYCCTERCWPTTRQARRCETPNRSTSITTARRRRSGLTSFPAHLLEHVDVEGLLGDQLLEPLILPLKLLEPFGVFGFHPAVLISPAMPGLLTDLQMPADLPEVFALTEQPFTLTKLADHLLRCMPSTCHESSPPRPNSGASDSHRNLINQGVTGSPSRPVRTATPRSRTPVPSGQQKWHTTPLCD